MLYISHPTVDSWWWCVTNAFSLLEHHRLCHPVTHLAHTSSGSIHTVTSCGRQRSAGVSSLSSHAFSTSSSQRTPLFIRMHLWRTRCSLSWSNHFVVQWQCQPIIRKWKAKWKVQKTLSRPAVMSAGLFQRHVTDWRWQKHFVSKNPRFRRK